MGLTREEFRQQLRQEFIPIRDGLKEVKVMVDRIIELIEKRQQKRKNLARK